MFQFFSFSHEPDVDVYMYRDHFRWRQKIYINFLNKYAGVFVKQTTTLDHRNFVMCVTCCRLSRKSLGINCILRNNQSLKIKIVKLTRVGSICVFFSFSFVVYN